MKSNNTEPMSQPKARRDANQKTNPETHRLYVFNDDIIAGKWLQVKGELQRAWGDITENEFESTKGDINVLRGLVQERYGYSKEKFHEKLDEIMDKFRQH